LTGRLAALSRFISKLGEKALPFYRLLQKTDNFTWTEEAQAVFDNLKCRLSTFRDLVTPWDDLVLCLKQTSMLKLEPPWEGPYLVHEVIPGGAYHLRNPKTGKDVENPWNAAQLRCFYP
jgi:hypothetical protein